MTQDQIDTIIGTGQAITSVVVAGERLVTADRDGDPENGLWRIVRWDDSEGALIVEDRRRRMGGEAAGLRVRRCIAIRHISEIEVAHEEVPEVPEGPLIV